MDTEFETNEFGATPGALSSELAEEATPRNETTINETAKRYDVTFRALRFYEDRGLICPRRFHSSQFYSGVDRARIEMVLKGKQLGFTLTEISQLIGAPDPNRAITSDFERRLKPSQISAQLEHLERQRREIEMAIAGLRAVAESDA